MLDLVRQLEEALESGKTFIVTMPQKFPVIAEEIGELPGKRFEVIVDEAYFSQSGESPKSPKAVLASELFARGLNYCIPVRGAISHGRFLFNLGHNLFAGPPMVSAHHLAEEAQWLGIRVDEAVAAKAQAVPLDSRGRPPIIEWAVPVKSGGRAVSHVVDWVESHRANFTVAPPIGVDAFYQPFVRLFGPLEVLPAEVRLKYENTVEFVNERLRA